MSNKPAGITPSGIFIAVFQSSLSRSPFTTYYKCDIIVRFEEKEK